MRADVGFYANVLDTMSGGVLTLDAKGVITTLNRRASLLLGVAPEDVVDRTFAEVFFGEEGTDAFSEAVLAAIYEQEMLHHRRIAYQAGGRDLQFDVTTAVLRGDGGTRLGVLIVFDDVSEVDRLRAAEAAMADELKQNHGQLQTAYLTLEEKTQRLETIGKRLRLAQLAGTAIVLLGIGGIGWMATGRSLLPQFGGGQPAEVAQGTNTVTIQRAPVSARIGIVGALEPGDTVSVVAPFDGLVKERRFEYGNRVERGDVLFVMDTGELENKLREARSTFITADQKLREVMTWASGTEVSRARRAVATADVALEDARQRMNETKRLLERGIVAEQELRSAQQQERSSASQQEAAVQDLAATMMRGNADNRRLAELQHETAKFRLGELEGQFKQAQIVAPVAGVALLPPQGGGGGGDGKSNRMERGARLSQGQAALLIGNLERLAVRAKIDEVAIVKVKAGLRAEITADALSGFSAGGRVTAVSSQGTLDGSGRPPTFDVLISLDPLPADAAAIVRVGMTANVSILAYENPSAIIVPAYAVREEGAERFVMVAAGAQTRRVPVEVVRATENGVEIKGALEDGAQVVLP